MTLRVVLVPWFAAMLLVLAFPVRAAVDVYEVANVAVDVTADTAAAAKDRALIEGERAAFYTLLKRLTPRAMHERLPQLDRAQITTHVRDFAVQQEKNSAVATSQSWISVSSVTPCAP